MSDILLLCDVDRCVKKDKCLRHSINHSEAVCRNSERFTPKGEYNCEWFVQIEDDTLWDFVKKYNKRQNRKGR